MTPSRWRRSSSTPQKQPPARMAVSALSLIAVPSSKFCARLRPRFYRWSANLSALAQRRPRAHERVLVLGGEDMDAELGGDVVTDAHAADAVAVDVQTGREDADAALARDDGKD